MDPLIQLDVTLGGELQCAGGILDRLNYTRLRRLGGILRNIPRPTNDWDLPPASLQGWLSSYSAALESLRIASESGLLDVLRARADNIRAVLSRDILPAIDEQIVGEEVLDQLVAEAVASDKLKALDLEVLQKELPSNEDLARILVVNLHKAVPYRDRPKIDERTGLARLKLGAIIGQVALGGALAVGNLSLGVLGGIITSFHGMSSGVPASVAICASTYTGFNGLLGALDKLADFMKSRRDSRAQA